MRDLIKQIVEAGGTVQFPYKRVLKDWMGEAKITLVHLRPGEPINVVHWPGGMDRFETLDKALDFYMKTVFTRRNLALAVVGIKTHNLTDKELDDLSDKEFRGLVRQYNDGFFAQDYPFAK